VMKAKDEVKVEESREMLSERKREEEVANFDFLTCF